MKTAFVGPHGYGGRNERGDQLELFEENNELVVLNTFSNYHQEDSTYGNYHQINQKKLSAIKLIL